MARDVGRSRGRQQLRRARATRRSIRTSARDAPPPIRPTSSTCHCATRRARRARASSCAPVTTSGSWRASTCWTVASTERLRPASFAAAAAPGSIDERCRELRDPERTMLGHTQERWLTRGMATTAERWNFLAQQTLMARAGVMVGGRRRFSSDPWDGYPAARDRLFDAITSNGLGSCVVLSGDAHAAFVCDLKRNFGDRLSPPIATEFCATSITTRGRPQPRSTRSCETTLTFTSETARTAVTASSTSPRTAARFACAPSRTPPTATPASPRWRPSASTPAGPARVAFESLSLRRFQGPTVRRMRERPL